MKRNKKLVHGPSVRYFQHSAGIVNNKKPALVRLVLPMLSTLMLLGGGGYYGLVQYQKSRPVVLSNQSQFEPVEIKEAEESTINLEPFQAREDELLAGEIQKTIDSLPDDTEWAVSVRDLNSGRMANINSDKKMEAASFYKMFLLAPLEKRLSADYWSSYIGSQPISECVIAMIEISDNDCPVSLGDYMGWNTVDILNHELGFNNTTVNTTDGNKTTAKDMSELVYRLQNSMILSDKARRLVFDALYEQRYRDGIPTGCGQDCLVGNKTGNLDGIKHDAAVVKHREAHYIIVIMSTGNGSWDQVAEIAGSVDKAMLP